MKKKLLIASVLFLTGFSYAQTSETPANGTLISSELLNELNHQTLERLNAVNTDREAINGWVSFEQTSYNYVYGPDAFYTYGQVISPDSLPRVSFTGGTFRSYTHGFGQIFDPTAEDMELSETRLSSLDSYTIDSVGFPHIYRRVNHNGIDDTLLITIAITDKETELGNPYDGSYWWSPSGLLSNDTYVMVPSYAGNPAHGNHAGLTGTTDAGENVEILTYKFPLTEADTDINWRSFPVDIVAQADQVIYTFVEFQASFDATIEDTAFVFDGAEGVANTNSYRTVYDYPSAEQTGYFFDLYREDEFSYNCSYVASAETRYAAYTGDNAWRNNRLEAYSWWGFRFEYYMDAISSLSIDEANDLNHLSIQPNPANGDVVIELGQNEALNGNLIIHDLEGRIVYEQSVQGLKLIKLNTVALSLDAGVYLITLSNAKENYSQKLIVE